MLIAIAIILAAVLFAVFVVAAVAFWRLGRAVVLSQDLLAEEMVFPGMACVGDGVGDVDPETAEALRQCSKAHDRLVEFACGGGN